MFHFLTDAVPQFLYKVNPFILLPYFDFMRLNISFSKFVLHMISQITIISHHSLLCILLLASSFPSFHPFTGSWTAKCIGGDGSCLNSFICKSLLVLHLLLFNRKVNSSVRWKKWASPEQSPPWKCFFSILSYELHLCSQRWEVPSLEFLHVVLYKTEFFSVFFFKSDWINLL